MWLQRPSAPGPYEDSFYCSILLQGLILFSVGVVRRVCSTLSFSSTSREKNTEVDTAVALVFLFSWAPPHPHPHPPTGRVQNQAWPLLGADRTLFWDQPSLLPPSLYSLGLVASLMQAPVYLIWVLGVIKPHITGLCRRLLGLGRESALGTVKYWTHDGWFLLWCSNCSAYTLLSSPPGPQSCHTAHCSVHPIPACTGWFSLAALSLWKFLWSQPRFLGIRPCWPWYFHEFRFLGPKFGGKGGCGRKRLGSL